MIMDIKTLGDFRKATKNLDDDFALDIKIARAIPKKELGDMRYPYPWNFSDAIVKFNDVGYSDKAASLIIYEVDSEYRSE